MTCWLSGERSLPFGLLVLFLLGVGVVDGLLYAVGGHDGPLVRNSVEVYNPETNSWSQLADMYSCRRNAGKLSYEPL